MTEADWLSSNDPLVMYRFLQESTTLMRTRWQGWVPVRRFRFSERQQAIFRCHVAERLLDLVDSEAARNLVEACFQSLFGEARQSSLPLGGPLHTQFLTEVNAAHPPQSRTAWEALRALLAADPGQQSDGLYLASVARAESRAEHGDLWQRVAAVEMAQTAQAGILRELVGNPFHELQIGDEWKTWAEGLIPGMARRIDREQDFDALPVLGDALEDAGCVDAPVLEHCRQGGRHLRGCWALEFLLGSS